MRDLLVAGGGPAGLATALYAAREGLDVVVLEQRSGIVDKACGEGLMPGALAALLDLKVDPPGREIAGIRYVSGTGAAQARFRLGPGRGVRRTALHRAMREAALDAGVRIEQRAVDGVEQDGAGVEAGGLRGRYLVAADGLHSPLRRTLGLDAPRGSHRRFGLRRHFAVEPWSSFVEVHWGEVGEAYVTPVAPDLVGVAMLSSSRGPFDEHLRRFPVLQDRLQAPVGDVLGAGPLRQRTRRRVAGRVLLVGDASGYVDALTGEGVALAVAQARVAVAAVRDGRPQRYETEWRQVTRGYRMLTSGLLQATRLPPVRRALVSTATRLPSVFDAAVNTLARPA